MAQQQPNTATHSLRQPSPQWRVRAGGDGGGIVQGQSSCLELGRGIEPAMTVLRSTANSTAKPVLNSWPPEASWMVVAAAAAKARAAAVTEQQQAAVLAAGQGLCEFQQVLVAVVGLKASGCCIHHN